MKKYVTPTMKVDEIKNDMIQTFCLDGGSPGCDGNFSGCTKSIGTCSGDGNPR